MNNINKSVSEINNVLNNYLYNLNDIYTLINNSLTS